MRTLKKALEVMEARWPHPPRGERVAPVLGGEYKTFEDLVSMELVWPPMRWALPAEDLVLALVEEKMGEEIPREERSPNDLTHALSPKEALALMEEVASAIRLEASRAQEVLLVLGLIRDGFRFDPRMVQEDEDGMPRLARPPEEIARDLRSSGYRAMEREEPGWLKDLMRLEWGERSSEAKPGRPSYFLAFLEDLR